MSFWFKLDRLLSRLKCFASLRPHKFRHALDMHAHRHVVEVPGGHKRGEAAPSGQYAPRSHSLHEALPGTFWKLPPRQGEHVSSSRLLLYPGWQRYGLRTRCTDLLACVDMVVGVTHRCLDWDGAHAPAAPVTFHGADA